MQSAVVMRSFSLAPLPVLSVQVHTEKASACTAMWLGDSYAFGQGVDYDESMIGRIDKELPDIENINMAVGGYGPTQYRSVLEYELEQGQAPDLLFVVTFVGNDFHDTQWSKDTAVEDGILGNEQSLKSTLKRNLHLYRLGSSVYHQLVSHDSTRYDVVVHQLASPEAWNQDFMSKARSRYELELTRIVEIARERGIPVAFVILPTRDAVLKARDEEMDLEQTADPSLPVRKAVDIIERLNVDYLDATAVIAEIPTEEAFFMFDGHLTPKGSAQVAKAFLGKFSPQCSTADKAS